MTPASRTLHFDLLEKVRLHISGKITARCPACAEEGGDRKGNHLVIFPDDRFACAAHGGDGEHRKRIMALIGVRSGIQPDPEQRRQWRERSAIEQRRRTEALRLAESVRAHRRDLIRRFTWYPTDVWHDSPQRIDGDLVATEPTHFLASLFRPSDVLWTGEVHHSGSIIHAERWRPCRDWYRAAGPIGPMTTPAVWKPETHSRASGNVLSAPYTVLDFDGFDGIKPASRDALSRHVHDSLALVRWLREGMGWHLAAILWTGGKSLHAWFHTPPPAVLGSLHPVAKSFGMDSGLIGRPEHPCRLPGQVHRMTHRISRVLWLQSSPSLLL